MAETRDVQVPDGKGGWKTVQAEVSPGLTLDAKRQQQVAFETESRKLTDYLLKVDRVYLQERNLVPEHRVFAAALYYIHLRRTYPSGYENFDAIAKAADEYYDRVVVPGVKK